MKPKQRKLAYIAVIALVATIGIVVYLTTTPIQVEGPGGFKTLKVCDIKVTTSGSYDEFAFITSYGKVINNFQVNAGAVNCRAKTLLDIAPRPDTLNLFPTTATFQFSVIDQNGQTHGPYSQTIDIPALQSTFSFTETTVIAGVESGTYKIEVTSSLPLVRNSVKLTQPVVIDLVVN